MLFPPIVSQDGDELEKNEKGQHNQKKTQNLPCLLSRFFRLHPFYAASKTFLRSYPLLLPITSSTVATSSPSVPEPLTQGVVEGVLGAGAVGVALLAQRAVSRRERDDQDSSYCLPRSDSALLETEQSPSPSTSSPSGEVSGGRQRKVSESFVIKFSSLEGSSLRMINSCLRESCVLRSCAFFSILKMHRCFITVKSDAADTEIAVEVQDDMPAAHTNMTAVTLELEFMNNGDLRAELLTRARQEPKRYFNQRNLLLIFVQVTMAVHYLHNRKHTLHRDIKSPNIFLRSNGLVKLGDFGFSKPFSSEEGVQSPRNGSLCGTPRYMAPEVWSGSPYGEKADMFALGVVLFEMMELRRPFPGLSRDSIRQCILDCDLTPPLFSEDGRYSEDLQSLVRRLLSFDPAQRPSALEVLAMPPMRESMRTFLEVIHREKPCSTGPSQEKIIADGALSNTNRSGCAEDEHSTATSFSVRQTATISASEGHHLQLSAEERATVLEDVRSTVSDVVHFVVRTQSSLMRIPPPAAAAKVCHSSSLHTSPPPCGNGGDVESLTSLPLPLHPASLEADPVCWEGLLMSGTVYGEDSTGHLRRRCLQLHGIRPSATPAAIVEGGDTTQFQLSLGSSSHPSRSGKTPKTQSLSAYIDCYPQHASEHPCFVLVSRSGARLRLFTKKAEARNKWVSLFLACLSKSH